MGVLANEMLLANLALGFKVWFDVQRSFCINLDACTPSGILPTLSS
jgi:hypothetical protein